MSSQLSSGGAPIRGSRGREDARLGAEEAPRHGEPFGGGAAVDWSPELVRRRARAAAVAGAAARRRYRAGGGEARVLGGGAAHHERDGGVGDGWGASPAANRREAGAAVGCRVRVF
jgi:hypothetical protein